jgi:hypothetical protein
MSTPSASEWATRIFGYGDDNVAIDGEYEGEVGCFGATLENPVSISCSDGTTCRVFYEKMNQAGTEALGVWGIIVDTQGDLFDHLEECWDDDADPYSDILYLRPVITRVEAKFGRPEPWEDDDEEEEKPGKWHRVR